MWYLSALFFWRLMTPVFMRMPAPRDGIAVVVSLLAGLNAGDTLDTARIFGLLPFFVLGLQMREGAWQRLRRPGRAVGVAVLGRMLSCPVHRPAGSNRVVLLPVPLRRAGARRPCARWRSGCSCSAAGCSAPSFFALVPTRRGLVQAMGAATLVVYLFHGFVVLGRLRRLRLDHQHRCSRSSSPLRRVGLALPLAAPPVAKVLKVAVDPLGWLEQRRQALTAPRSD